MTRGKAARLVSKGHRVNGRGVLETLGENVHYMATVVLPKVEPVEIKAADHDVGMATISHGLQDHQLLTLQIFEELDTERS